MAASAPNFDILVKGTEIPDAHLMSFVIERDLNQPDMAAIVIDNQEDAYSTRWAIGDDIVVKVGDDKKQIFKGQIVGFEAAYRGEKKTTLLLRAMNGMHRMLRKRISRTRTFCPRSAALTG
jgi:hypothetical protein